MSTTWNDAPGVVAAEAGSRGQGTATGSGKDLSNLDLLRAVAVINVLVAHVLQAKNWMPAGGTWYGAFGVGLFFLHTALVLMWSLERRPHTLDFYVRRVARIYPLALVVVLAAVATHVPVATYHEGGPFFVYQHATVKQIASHLLLVQNLFSGNFLVYPMWSLPIEVQMYAVLPVLFFFLRKNMALWPLLLFWALAAGFAHKSFDLQEVNLAVAVPYFLPGLMAYVGFSRRKAVLPAWGFVVLLTLVVWVGGHGSAGNWQKAWWPCLVLGLALPLFRQLRASWFTQLCWVVARYSYGIYLTHPFALVLAFYVGRGWSLPVQFAVLLGSLTAFSVASFHLIEAPFMRMGAKAAVSVTKRFPMPATAERRG